MRRYATNCGRVAGIALAFILALCVAVAALKSREIEYELGYLYESGRLAGIPFGLGQDDRQAASWFARAASAGDARAQYRLGILYAHGRGVTVSSREAVGWFRRAAQNGYAPAQYHLGWMLYKGDDVARDAARATRLMQQAAGQGMAAAYLALGRFNEQAADSAQALRNYERALTSARTQPQLFDNAAFALRAHNARDALLALSSSHYRQ
jgi:TPR repeat protein